MYVCMHVSPEITRRHLLERLCRIRHILRHCHHSETHTVLPTLGDSTDGLTNLSAMIVHLISGN